MRSLHEWNLSYAEAWRVQVELAGRVEFVPLRQEPRLIAGLDCAFSGDGKWTFAAAVVLRVKPVFVSVGYKCALEEAIRITLACATKYRIPEPTRLAHQAVGKVR
jgi:deoxyinosine 3'endonuclease (endonuclease V)